MKEILFLYINFHIFEEILGKYILKDIKILYCKIKKEIMAKKM